MKLHRSRFAITVLTSLAAQPAGALDQESWVTDFDRHTVPLDEVVATGVPRDGIPAIDRPSFISIAEADGWIAKGEPVAVLDLGGETRAYPLQILLYHEIVNDEVGGIPVSVTYCPLCNTTLAFDRRLAGYVLDFGTTGRLRYSDLIMYDRQTETWWQQATGEGIIGELSGKNLSFIPAPVFSWRDVKRDFPGARVLSRDTGFERNYGQNPYARYDRRAGPIPGLYAGETPDRLPLMERVVALSDGKEAIAVPFSLLHDVPVVHLTVGERQLVVFWAPGTSSPVDHSWMDASRDVGSGAAFDRRLEDRLLSFEPAQDGFFRDLETGSLWSVTGTAVSGPLQGRRLVEAPHGNHFWFAWAAFKPQTRVWIP